METIDDKVCWNCRKAIHIKGSQVFTPCKLYLEGKSCEYAPMIEKDNHLYKVIHCPISSLTNITCAGNPKCDDCPIDWLKLKAKQ